MKLGFFTAPFPGRPLEEVAKWGAESGFQAIEIACWPLEKAARRYAGVKHIDVSTLDHRKAKEIRKLLDGYGLIISSLGYYPNPLHPEAEHRETVSAHLKKVIEAAALLEVPVVGTFIGKDKNKTVPQNLEDYARVWPPIVQFAKERGVKIAIENCPMIFSYDEWPGGNNIAWSPMIWRRILEQWGGTVGLNYDPSHLVWLMIDQGRFIREFGQHILHFQAKDVTIDRDGLYERGSMSSGMGWQIPRLPGLGDAPWDEIFANLYRVGYDGDCIIEHEDRRFEKTDQLIKRGFLLARNILRPYIPKGY